ncbi:hypothetical protein Q5M85_18685 [Paraclostridium bifermentans]|nr:hypothetical protein [Paraclostridium bifermentans]
MNVFWWKLENKEINIKMNEEEIIINGLNSETMASDELIELMLKNIGSPSPKLRDNIIYIGWVNLVESNKISINKNFGYK